MRTLGLAVMVAIFSIVGGVAPAAQEGHDHMKGMDMPTKQTDKTPA